MKALLREGFEWVDIDTTYIFDDQYNTMDGKRIFDRDIIRLYDDERLLNKELCSCGFCGKQFRSEADYQRHLEEEKALIGKTCKKCVHCHVEREEIHKEQSSTPSEIRIGDTWEVMEVIKWRKTAICSFARDGERYGSCAHEAHSMLPKRDVCHTFGGGVAYFIRKPYGDIFDGFKYSLEKPYVTEVKLLNDHGQRRTFAISVDWKTLEWTAKAKKWQDRKALELSGRTEVYKSRWDGVCLVCDNADFVYGYRQGVSAIIKRLVGQVKLYNEVVCEDRNYIQPDGTMLESVELDGKTVSRPKPVDTTGWNWIDE